MLASDHCGPFHSAVYAKFNIRNTQPLLKALKTPSTSVRTELHHNERHTQFWLTHRGTDKKLVWLRNYRYHHHHPPYHPLPNSQNPVADRFVRFHFASGESSASPVVCLWTECVCGWAAKSSAHFTPPRSERNRHTHTHTHIPLGGRRKSIDPLASFTKP